jgi:hypothetical protein
MALNNAQGQSTLLRVYLTQWIGVWAPQPVWTRLDRQNYTPAKNRTSVAEPVAYALY